MEEVKRVRSVEVSNAGTSSLLSQGAQPFWFINMFTNREALLGLIVQSFYGSFIT